MKHYIYVAGHDYAYTGVDFSRFAWARMARQAAKDTSKEDRDFIIFDIRAGSIDTFQHRFPGGKLRKQQIGQSRRGAPSARPFHSVSPGIRTPRSAPR